MCSAQPAGIRFSSSAAPSRPPPRLDRLPPRLGCSAALRTLCMLCALSPRLELPRTAPAETASVLRAMLSGGTPGDGGCDGGRGSAPFGLRTLCMLCALSPRFAVPCRVGLLAALAARMSIFARVPERPTMRVVMSCVRPEIVACRSASSATFP